MLPLHVTDPALAAARLEALIPGPVAPARLAVGESLGLPLATDLLLPQALPARDTAARDGWALCAADTAGASAYAPAPLAGAPWVEAGDTLPSGADAVLPAFEVEEHGPLLMALAEAVPGDGVQPAGADAPLALLLRHAGQRLRAADLPLLAMAGIASVAVRRPRVALLPIGDEIMASPILDRTGPFLLHLLAAEGAEARILPPAGDDPASIAEALRAGAAEADLLLTLGGTGLGRRDHAAAGLALAGEVLLHGLGAWPGHSTGFGHAGGRPVILVPGHPADALAGWLLLARPALRRLSGALPAAPRRARLGRKIASGIGLAELVLLRRGAEPDLVEPLATGTLPLSALAAAEAMLVVPPASEGYEAGRWVEVEEI
ncbi:molybdopterin-binding protein [Teichococcus wenyumeiae]|nr:molybdopterin-binding protein [Pseudoroseomonas wenyumeiae]